jgi:hypothetical protein
MFPDSENCFGRIKPGDNLRIVAVRLRLRDWKASVEESPDDDDRLHIESEVFKLRSASTDSEEHILDGVFDVDRKRGESGIAKLSDDLQELGIPHHFELYDDSGNMRREFKFEGG